MAVVYDRFVLVFTEIGIADHIRITVSIVTIGVGIGSRNFRFGRGCCRMALTVASEDREHFVL
jgi:hypothetical protein